MMPKLYRWDEEDDGARLFIAVAAAEMMIRDAWWAADRAPRVEVWDRSIAYGLGQ